MDPATIAGLVLGVVPLIISAVENYEITFQPFVTYRRYSKEIANFATRLDAQKAIFNNQCQLLLLSADKDGVQGDVILDNILKSQDHPSRKNEALNKHLENLLGMSARSCVSTLHLIQQTLDEITRETKGFQELSNKKPGERIRFRHFKSKLKISFSKTRLNDIINELRLHNEDLRVLSNQVTAVAVERRSKLKQSSSPPVLDDLRTAQQASRKLYSLLATRWVCNNQVDHAANLSLDIKKSHHCNTLGMRFSVSMACISEDTASPKDAIWLSVESMPTEESTGGDEERAQTAEHMHNMTNKLRDLGLAVESSDKNLALSTASRSVGTLSTIPAATPFTPQIEKLCSYFYSQLQLSTNTETFAVYSETTNKFEHLLYKSHCPLGFINATLSLDEILKIDADRRRREAWTSKFKLARQLTLAVLRFQSTPWVRETFNSKDIHFLESKASPKNQGYSLEDPFIRIQLSQTPSSQQLTANSDAYQLYRNELLFNLGVILLELGYDAPLRYLQNAEDIREGETKASWYTRFFTARRLGKGAPRELDARYGRLAKKCLDCDFGVGDDLNSMELQTAIVIDIVNELDRCIRADRHIDSILSF